MPQLRPILCRLRRCFSRVKVRHNAPGEIFLRLHGMRVALHLLDVGNLHIREPLVVAPHHFVGDTHDLAVHFKRRLVDADRIAERLRHFLHAVEAFQNRRGHDHL